ncbi:neuronal acetylcholine receptor subunit alpha-9-like isoform X1 [Dreissena polymorpha]|uniref:neuronal acetylcholine receptor subunit alpha-9-like isoform X1 n=2 Tax=Dreissena polymorpha TaxID=45954 RepID=UPI0022653EED|nr:neuronal acetylcholine receptor subunit alpha-9-like isoform X1 [Dreissena polymorpha]
MDAFVFLMISSFITDSVYSVSNQVISKNLRDFLFTGYDVSILPQCTSGEKVTLNVDMALRQILELNERDQILTANIWMRTNWNDCRLQWDTISYNNITYLTVTFHDVWKPDTTLYDSAGEEVMFPGWEDFRVSISNSGQVTYNFPSVVKSICRVNVKYFPFDTQECNLKFGSWSYNGFDLDIVNRNSNGDLDNFIEHTEWKIRKLPAERHEFYYNCCPEPYPDVTFTIVMERRPAFYLLTMLLPCILTSCVAALGFLLPVESGEKVSLEITVLLSLAVFLLLVSESLPPSSDDFPVIGSYFACSMVLVSFSLLQTVLVLNVFYRGTNGRRVPRWANVFFLQFLGRALCIQSNKVAVQSDSTDEEQFPDDTNNADNSVVPINVKGDVRNHSNISTLKFRAFELQTTGIYRNPHSQQTNIQNDRHLLANESSDSATTNLKRIVGHLEEDHLNESISAEWRDISNVMDRFFFILYALVTVITTMSFLLQAV